MSLEKGRIQLAYSEVSGNGRAKDAAIKAAQKGSATPINVRDLWQKIERGAAEDLQHVKDLFVLAGDGTMLSTWRKFSSRKDVQPPRMAFLGFGGLNIASHVTIGGKHIGESDPEYVQRIMQEVKKGSLPTELHHPGEYQVGAINDPFSWFVASEGGVTKVTLEGVEHHRATLKGLKRAVGGMVYAHQHFESQRGEVTIRRASTQTRAIEAAVVKDPFNLLGGYPVDNEHHGAAIVYFGKDRPKARTSDLLRGLVTDVAVAHLQKSIGRKIESPTGTLITERIQPDEVIIFHNTHQGKEIVVDSEIYPVTWEEAKITAKSAYQAVPIYTRRKPSRY